MTTTMTCPRCGAPSLESPGPGLEGLCPRCVMGFAMEAPAPAAPGLKDGSTLGSYEILGRIGKGGMGVVYRARHTGLDRVVALKVLSPAYTGDPEFVARFHREAKALAALSHPNIVAVHDAGVEGDLPYLAMELLEGVSLRRLLSERRLPPEEALHIVPQLCDALEYAHRRGIVHRDIKPENILIDAAGRVKIADFGLAKVVGAADRDRLTQTNVAMGTPHYMAPEQFESPGKVDHRADIYSMGVVFYEMLTGELPIGRFAAPSRTAPVNSRLDEIVHKALEKEPDARYQRAGEVKTAIEGCSAAGGPGDVGALVRAIARRLNLSEPPDMDRVRFPSLDLVMILRLRASRGTPMLFCVVAEVREGADPAGVASAIRSIGTTIGDARPKGLGLNQQDTFLVLVCPSGFHRQWSVDADRFRNGTTLHLNTVAGTCLIDRETGHRIWSRLPGGLWRNDAAAIEAAVDDWSGGSAPTSGAPSPIASPGDGSRPALPAAVSLQMTVLQGLSAAAFLLVTYLQFEGRWGEPLPWLVAAVAGVLFLLLFSFQRRSRADAEWRRRPGQSPSTSLRVALQARGFLPLPLSFLVLLGIILVARATGPVVDNRWAYVFLSILGVAVAVTAVTGAVWMAASRAAGELRPEPPRPRLSLLALSGFWLAVACWIALAFWILFESMPSERFGP